MTPPSTIISAGTTTACCGSTISSADTAEPTRATPKMTSRREIRSDSRPMGYWKRIAPMVGATRKKPVRDRDSPIAEA